VSASRRTLLRATGGALLGAGLTGCGHAAASPTTSRLTSPTAGAGGERYPGDLALVAVGAAVDALLVRAYDLAATGTVGPTPFAAYLTAARSHHAAHAAAWTRLLAAAGVPPVSADSLRTATATLTGIGGATDDATVATRLLALEQTAAATALAAVGAAGDERVVGLAATVAPVEAQHVAVLALLLGQPPAAAAQLTSAGALGAASLS
jgi:hypothetical protein